MFFLILKRKTSFFFSLYIARIANKHTHYTHMDATEITEKLKTELGSQAGVLDGDILNYAGSIIADSESESVDEIVEALVPFLVDTGCAESADKVKEIVLRITGRKENEFVTTKHTLEMLDAPISLYKFEDTTKSDWDAYIKKSDNVQQQKQKQKSHIHTI